MPPSAIFQHVALNLLGEPVAVFRCSGNNEGDDFFALGLAHIGIKMAEYETNARTFHAAAAEALKKGYASLVQTYKSRRDGSSLDHLPVFGPNLSASCPIMS